MNKVFIGLPVTYILMSIAVFFNSIATGSLRSLTDLPTIINSSLFLPFTLLTGSIVCTLGVSLILWIPIWWIVGSITILVAPRLGNTLNEARPEANNQLVTAQRASPAQRAIAQYIKKAENSGLSDQAIDNRLVANGWSEDEIELARGLANIERRRG